jgi:dTDP-L-rhamnose 4-epimerase
MTSRVLVTGGAGFIGTRLANRLCSQGVEVGVLDNLHAQVHGDRPDPIDLDRSVFLRRCDIADRSSIDRVLAEFDPDCCVHLAAETGTGQSMDEVARYCQANVMGTAHLLEGLSNHAPRMRRIVLASSRAVYGEGKYVTASGGVFVPAQRASRDLEQRRFDIREDERGESISPIPTTEDTPPRPVSVYGSTKLIQEQLMEQIAGLRGWDMVTLRFQNVFGDGQSLRNPYTGVLSIFVAQLLDGKTLNIYEDGAITRDFVYVDDVVDALMYATQRGNVGASPINIGSGSPTTILSVAAELIAILNLPDDRFRVTGDFRPGDIRFAVANIEHARSRLGWSPKTDLRSGLTRLVDWSVAQRNAVGRNTAH